MIATVAERWRPRAFAGWALHASTFWGLACVPIAMVFSTLSAYRLSQTVHVDDIVFGPTRFQEETLALIPCVSASSPR